MTFAGPLSTKWHPYRPPAISVISTLYCLRPDLDDLFAGQQRANGDARGNLIVASRAGACGLAAGPAAFLSDQPPAQVPV
jgi:hypothetical protein